MIMCACEEIYHLSGFHPGIWFGVEGAWQFNKLCSSVHCREHFLGGNGIAWFLMS